MAPKDFEATARSILKKLRETCDGPAIEVCRRLRLELIEQTKLSIAALVLNEDYTAGEAFVRLTPETDCVRLPLSFV
jgi:hypothetical protein